MIIISSRADFTNPDVLLPEGHTVRDVNLSDDLFEVIDIETLTLQEKKICLLVHGYNNEHDEVRDAYQILEQNIKAQNLSYDLIIGYSWPGGNRALEWWDAKSRANAVARRFRLLLESFLPKEAKVDVISHSLGARVVLKALKEASQPIVQNYYCMAAAVDNESIERNEEFYPALANLDSLFVFHSSKDEVLATAYRAAEFDNALGLFGPEDKSQIEEGLNNVYVANCKKVVSHHGGYKRSPEVFSYLASTQARKPPKFVTLS
jgi:esterase/lipase superfamily enzyme